MCEQWRLHRTSQWRWQMSLSEQAYCVAVTFKMIDWVEQQICIKFCIKQMNIPPWKLFGWFRNLQLWATGDWQLHQDNMPTQVSCLLQSFLAKHQVTVLIQPLYRPDLALCDFWFFPKLKSPWKGWDFRPSMRFRRIQSQLMVIGRTMWGPREPSLKGTEASLSYVQCFLYLWSSSINAPIFHVVWLDTFWTDLILLIKLIKSLFNCVNADFPTDLANDPHAQLFNNWSFSSIIN